MKDYKAKIILNEKNRQLIIFLSRKKLEILKKKDPKFLKIRKEDLEF